MKNKDKKEKDKKEEIRVNKGLPCEWQSSKRELLKRYWLLYILSKK